MTAGRCTSLLPLALEPLGFTDREIHNGLAQSVLIARRFGENRIVHRAWELPVNSVERGA